MSTREARPKGKKLHLSRRIGAIFLVLFTVLILLVFFCYYWQKVTNREKLASFLPADSTVTFLEFNLSRGRLDSQEFQKLVTGNIRVSQYVNSAVALVPGRELFEQWYTGKGGLAILSTPDGQDFQPVLFLGKNDDQKVAEWIEYLTLDPKSDAPLDENYFGQKLISFRSGQNLHLLLMGEYVAIADNRVVLEKIAETVANRHLSLRGQPDFNQLSSALPEQNLGFLYLNRSRLLNVLTKNDQFLTGRLSLFKLYFPFLDMLSSEAMTFRLEEATSASPVLEMKHLSLYNRKNVDRTTDQFPFTEVDYYYTGKLENILPGGNIVRAGGTNLLDQRNKMQAYFKNSTDLGDLLFSGLMSSLQDLLSSPKEKADLDNNFFPVFQKEYLFYICNAHEKPNPSEKHMHGGLILESEYPDSDQQKIKKVIMAFGPELATQMTAKPVPMTLPDGTTGTELKADLSEPTTQMLNIDGQRVEQISLAPEFSIYLWADSENKLLAISNSDDDIKEIIARQSQKVAFGADYGLVKPSEAYYVDFQELAAGSDLFKGLEPVQYLKIARKYTSVGILSVYQLGL